MYTIVKPLLFAVPAELAHRLTFGALRFAHALPGVARVMRRWWVPQGSDCAVRALGFTFPSPIVLAAGFDKEALGFAALLDIGFGAVEVGTITGQAQPGNPRPRLFRLPRDRALLNRMGFNNCGSALAARRLAGPRRGIVGVNIGKTKVVPEANAISDYVESARRLAPVADYLVVNVSSPNTPGLRDLQAVERLRPLLEAVQKTLGEVSAERKPPLLVKIAPDLGDADILAIVDLALELGLDGIVATNTTVSRAGLATPTQELERLGAGGISGAPLESRALSVLQLIRSRAGSRLTLVAAGGVSTVDQAWQRITAGASLLQVYTALVYEGPGLPRRLAVGLAERARAHGFSSLGAAVEHYHAQPARHAEPALVS